MKLSDKEKLVLAGAELRAEAPIWLLRKETGLREHTIRYHLKNLIERGVMTPLPFINMHRLGFMVFNLFFSIGAEKKSTKEQLIKHLRTAPEVVWIGEFGGEYQYGIAVCVRQLHSLRQFLSELSKKFSAVFFEKAVSSQFGTRLFYRKYLSAKRFSTASMECAVTAETIEIDSLDHKVLTALSDYGGMSHRRLAQVLAMPLSTLELRLKKLEQRKVINGYYYGIDAGKFGMQSFKLLVYGKGLDAAFRTGLAKFCSSHPNIVYMIECFGSWDFEIAVEAPHAELVSDIVQELNEEFGPALNTIKVLSKFRDLKVRWYLGQG